MVAWDGDWSYKYTPAGPALNARELTHPAQTVAKVSDIAQDLVRKKCVPCEGGVAPLTDAQVGPLLRGLPGWERDGAKIFKEYAFKDHYQALAFVNAVAWIAHREDHHPDMAVGYNRVTVVFSTHSVSGLSENDFICAAKIDALGVK